MRTQYDPYDCWVLSSATFDSILSLMVLWGGALMTHDDMCPWSLMFGECRIVALEYNSDVVKP